MPSVRPVEDASHRLLLSDLTKPEQSHSLRKVVTIETFISDVSKNRNNVTVCSLFVTGFSEISTYTAWMKYYACDMK